MKKLIFVLLIGLLAGSAAFADHDGFGIGAVVGGGVTNGGWLKTDGLFYPGLSLKIPSIPIFWGLNANIHPYDNYGGFDITGDVYLFEPNMVSSTATNDDGSYYKIKIDWYFGLGMGLSSNFWHHGAGVGMCLRVPIGVSWHVVEPFEIAVGSVPAVGFYSMNARKTTFWWDIRLVEIAFRFWIKDKDK